MEKQTKYIYSATGVNIKEIEKIVKKSELNEKIDELADLCLKLIKNENFDRTQLEMYVTSHFQFEVLAKLIAEPLYNEDVVKLMEPSYNEEEKDEKWS